MNSNPSNRSRRRSLINRRSRGRRHLIKTLLPYVLPPIFLLIFFLFGLDPNSTNLLPVTWGEPFKIYEDKFEYFRYSSIDDEKEFTKLFTNNYDDYHKHDNIIIDQNVAFTFEVEGVAKSSESHLSSLRFQVERVNPPNLSTAFVRAPCPRGAGDGRKFIYRANISINDKNSSKKSFTVEAIPDPSIEKFDYIPVRNGERSNAKVDISINSPGKYSITPIAIFKYQDREYTHKFNKHSIILPSRVQVITQEECDSDKIKKVPLIMDELSHTFEGIDNINYSGKPIYFASSLLDSWHPRSFILYHNSIKMIPSIPGTSEYVSWVPGQNKILYKEFKDDEYKYSTIDIETEEISPAEGKDIKFYSQDNSYIMLKKGIKEPFSIYSSIQKDNLIALTIRFEKQNLEQVVILNIDTGTITRIQGSSNRCYQPAWNPSGSKIAFICLPNSNSTFGYTSKLQLSDLWVADIKGNSYMLTFPSKKITTPNWTSDGKQIIAGGDGLYLFSADLSSSPITIFSVSQGAVLTPQQQP